MQSALNLCDKLHLTPNPVQLGIIRDFYGSTKLLETFDNEQRDGTRAVAICAIWRILSVPGSSALIVTPSQDDSVYFMRFLEAVTKRCNLELAEISGFPSWNLLRFGGQPGWEMRILSNVPELIVPRAPRALVSVALNVKNSDPTYVEARMALEAHSTHPANTLIRVW